MREIRHFSTMVLGGILNSFNFYTQGSTMQLGIKCRYCAIELTTDNARKRKEA